MRRVPLADWLRSLVAPPRPRVALANGFADLHWQFSVSTSREDGRPPADGDGIPPPPEIDEPRAADFRPVRAPGTKVRRWLRGLWGSSRPEEEAEEAPTETSEVSDDSFVLSDEHLADRPPLEGMLTGGAEPPLVSPPIVSPPPASPEPADDDASRTLALPASSPLIAAALAEAGAGTPGYSDDITLARPATPPSTDRAREDDRIRVASLEAQLASAISARERHEARCVVLEREIEQTRGEGQLRADDLERRLAESADERALVAAALSERESELASARAARDQQQAKIAALEHLVNEARGEQDRTASALAKLERQFQSAAREHERVLQALQTEHTSTHQRIQGLEHDLLAAQTSSRNAKDALRDVEERAARTARELLAAQADDHGRRLGDLAARLEQAVDDRERARSSLIEVEAQATQDAQESLTILDRLRQDLEDTTTQLSRAEQKGVELELQLDRTRDDLGAERKQSQKLIAELGERVQALLRERESLTATLTERSAVAEELGTKLRSQTEVALQHQSTAGRLTKLVQDRDTDLARLKGELELRLTELNDARAIARRLESEFRELKSRFQGLTADRDAKEREYVALRSRLEAEIAELRSGIEDRDRRTAFLQESVDKAEMRVLEREDKLSAATKQLETLRARATEELGHRAQEIRKLKEDLAGKSGELAKFTTTLQERDRLRAEEVERVEARLREKDTQVNELLQLLETKAEAVRKVESQRAALADENVTLTQKLEAALERAKQFGQKLQERSVRASELETELREARQQKATAEDRARSIQSERDARQARMAELETVAREAKSGQQTLELRLRNLTERLDQREAQIGKLEATTLRLRPMEGAVANRDLHLRELEQSLATAEKQRAELELRVNEQARELELRSSRLAELELNLLEELPGAFDGSSRAVAEPSREIERLRAELQQKDGLILELQSASPSASADLGDFAALDRVPLQHVGEEETAATAPRAPRRPVLATALVVVTLAAAGFAAFGWLNRAKGYPATDAADGASSSTQLQPASQEAAARARDFVSTWADHIARRQTDQLVALYVPGYHGPTANDPESFARAWRELLATGDWVSVDLDALSVGTTQTGAIVANFPMEIRTAGHLEMGLRELVLEAIDASTLRIRDDRWAAARR